MFFPPFLYQLTPRDDQVTWLEVLFERVTGAALATTVFTGVYVIPKGRILLLQNVEAFAQSGAGQTCSRISVFVDNLGSNPSYNVASFTFPTPLLNASFCHNPGILVGEGKQVRAEATFNAGANSNSLILSIAGMLIPRGNFAI